MKINIFLYLLISLIVAQSTAIAEITGNVFLVRRNGDSVRIGDVEVVWFDKAAIESIEKYRKQWLSRVMEYDEEGRQLASKIQQLSKDQAIFMSRLITELREEKARQKTSVEKAAEELIPKIAKLKTERQRLLAESQPAIDDAFSASLSKHNELIASMRSKYESETYQIRNELERLSKRRLDLGNLIVGDLRAYSTETNYSLSAFLHSEDPEEIVLFLTRAQATSGKYNSLVRKAYIYSKRDIVFPYLYTRFQINTPLRNKIHGYLDELFLIEQERVRLASVLPEEPNYPDVPRREQFQPANLGPLNAEISAAEGQLAQVRQIFRDLTANEEADIQRGAEISWAKSHLGAALADAQRDVSKRNRDDFLNEEAKSVAYRFIFENLAHSERRVSTTRTDADGDFIVPENAVLIATHFYSSAVTTSGFGWLIAPGRHTRLTFSGSNAEEGAHFSVTGFLQSKVSQWITSNDSPEAIVAKYKYQ